jgi:hypothetical protein
MRPIRIYNESPSHPVGPTQRKNTMTTSLLILGGSLLLIVASACWVLRG